jgi:hypothetical protein
MAPRAYVITPVSGNAITLSYSYYKAASTSTARFPLLEPQEHTVYRSSVTIIPSASLDDRQTLLLFCLMA